METGNGAARGFTSAAVGTLGTLIFWDAVPYRSYTSSHSLPDKGLANDLVLKMRMINLERWAR